MNKVTKLLLPILIMILCAGILFLACIRPYEKFGTFLKIAFMDGSSSYSETGTAGLNIVETDIPTEYSGETYETGEIDPVSYGSQCAILSCDAIDLYVPVYWGSGAELLEKGAVQYPGAVQLGKDGNSVISAHVNTFFHNLTDLKVGDVVTAYTTYGKFTYTVSETISFPSTSKKYLSNTEDNRLTLYTCEQQLLGESDTRVGVICSLTSAEYYTEGGEDDE